VVCVNGYQGVSLTETAYKKKMFSCFMTLLEQFKTPDLCATVVGDVKSSCLYAYSLLAPYITHHK
jgi:hypothetical protein